MNVQIPYSLFKEIISTRKSIRLTMHLLALRHGGEFTARDMRDWLIQLGRVMNIRDVRRALGKEFTCENKGGANLYTSIYKERLYVYRNAPLTEIPILLPSELLVWWGNQHIKTGNKLGRKENARLLGISIGKLNGVYNLMGISTKRRCGYMQSESKELAKSKLEKLYGKNKVYVVESKIDSDPDKDGNYLYFWQTTSEVVSIMNEPIDSIPEIIEVKGWRRKGKGQMTSDFVKQIFDNEGNEQPSNFDTYIHTLYASKNEGKSKTGQSAQLEPVAPSMPKRASRIKDISEIYGSRLTT